MGLRGFYSYAPQDAEFLSELDSHLSGLRRQGFEFWGVRELLAGDDREAELARRLEEAQLILLLISANFLASDSCYAQLTRALERQRAGTAHVLPILVRQVDLLDTPLDGLDVLPEKDRAVKSWSDPDLAWKVVAQGIRAVAAPLLQVPSPAWAPAASALPEALEAYKREWAEDPRLRRMDLRGLAGISRGRHETELDLLLFAVAPSLKDETEEDAEHAAALRLQLRQQNLEPATRRELNAELARLQSARWSSSGTHHSRKTEPISFARALHRHRRLTVVGDAGSGKSVLTRLAFLACTDSEAGRRARTLLGADEELHRDGARAAAMLTRLLPVRLKLGELGVALAKEDGLSLQEFIRRQRARPQASSRLLRDGLGELLAAGRLFLLCDGLDEVAEAWRDRVVDEMSAVLEQYPEVRLLVTTRPSNDVPRVPGIARTVLAPLSHSQKHHLVASLHHLVETGRQPDARGVERARQRTAALLEAFRTQREWETLSGNPLLLTLSALTPAGENGAPRHRVFVFENFVNTLLGEWREVPGLPPGQADLLLELWSEVASELVRKELRHGVVEGRILQLLTSALAGRAAPAALDARTALSVALETGLVLEEAETIAFWHSTFAEFLAARALSGPDGRGAAARLLAEAHLPALVLELAAARLDHVLDRPEELDALVDGLLARDEAGACRLLRPGLRAISDCLVSGVCLSPTRVERVWATWAEVLERTAPSPLWARFGPLAEHAPPARLPKPLVSRFALIQDRGLKDVQEGLARLVAPHASDDSAVLAACERWCRQTDIPTNLLGALGLASTRGWSDAVIETLGRFASAGGLSPSVVGAAVRHGGRALLARLRELLGPGLAASAELSDLQLSAACLLAVAGEWDRAVMDAVREMLGGKPSVRRDDEAKRLVRSCAGRPEVAAALFEWLQDDSALGSHVQELLRHVAPLSEDMPARLLALTTRTQAPHQREKLEKLLASIAMERRSLLDTLHRWLDDEQEARSLSAARILRQLMPRDARLHAALRKGMRSPDDATRLNWANLAWGLGKELAELSMPALLACARSPDQSVRRWVYPGLVNRMGALRWKHFAEWIACAEDPSVPEAARLDAASFVLERPQGRAAAVAVLRELLDAADARVRWAAALKLLELEPKDSRAAVLVARQVARSGLNAEVRRMLSRATSAASELVQAILDALPEEGRLEEGPFEEGWISLLDTLSATEPSCLEQLLSALERPGQAGQVSEGVLRRQVEKSAHVRSALRQRLEGMPEGLAPEVRLRFVLVGLLHEETTAAALAVGQTLEPRSLTQEALCVLSWRLHDKGRQREAALLRRVVLEGPDLKLVREAMERLLDWVPEEAAEWSRPALPRLLASADPSLQLDAVGLALYWGLFTQESRTVLSVLAGLAGQPYEYARATTLRERLGKEVPERMHPWPPRIDFEAMEVLCDRWPDIGLPLLRAWLEDEDAERFGHAVLVLARHGEERNRVQEALERRLAMFSAEQLRSIVELAMRGGFSSPRLLEQVLDRYDPESPAFVEFKRCLTWWLRARPALWASLRRQGLERRIVLAELLHPMWRRLHRETLGFTVDLVLSEDVEGSSFIERLMQLLEAWCRSPKELETQGVSTLRAEVVRGWLRDALAERPVPGEVIKIRLFARLLGLCEQPEQCIEVLRRALDAGSDAETLEAGIAYASRVGAALPLLKLGGHDERIPPLLESAVQVFSRKSMEVTFRVAEALRPLRPMDGALRQSLRHAATVLAVDFTLLLDEVLTTLAQLGFSDSECAEILIERFQSEDAPRLVDVPETLDALERLGASTERRVELLLGFISRHEAALRAEEILELTHRPELPDTVVAKLLLRVLAQRGSPSRHEAVKLWLGRFVSEDSETRPDVFRSPSWETTYVSLYLNGLTMLSWVDKPDWMDAIVAGLGAPSATGFLERYRRAHTGASLSDSEWSELLDGLTVVPGDSPTVLLAKEWLGLRLWWAAEPSTVDALLKS
jgi:hypothetical protein